MYSFTGAYDSALEGITFRHRTDRSLYPPFSLYPKTEKEVNGHPLILFNINIKLILFCDSEYAEKRGIGKHVNSETIRPPPIPSK